MPGSPEGAQLLLGPAAYGRACSGEVSVFGCEFGEAVDEFVARYARVGAYVAEVDVSGATLLAEGAVRFV